MNKDILAKMETRRNAKPNTDIYNQLDEEIKRQCHAAKEMLLTEQCEMVKQLYSACKSQQMHTHIRKVTDRKNNTGLNQIY